MHARRRRTPVRWLDAFVAHPFFQIACGIGAGILVGYNYVLLRSAQAVHWNDFGKFYYAVLSWKSGASLYAPTVATKVFVESVGMQFLDLNPPHFHLLLVPIATVSLETSARIWLVANALAAVAAIVIVVRELNLRISIEHWLPLTCLGLASAATGANSLTAQCGGILMLPMALAWRAARRDEWGRCGVWLGVLVSIKPFLGLFLPTLALLREWRALRMLCVSALGCAVLGALVFGWWSYLEWFRALEEVAWVWAVMNGSIRALVEKSFGWSPYLTPIVLRPSLVTPLSIALSAIVAIASARVVRRSIDHAFSVTVLASLLISPLGWTYYLWLAMPGCFALWKARISPITWTGLLLLCVPLFGLAFGQPRAIATVTVASAYTWGILALWIGSVIDQQQSVRQTSAMVKTSPSTVPDRSNAPAAISTTA